MSEKNLDLENRFLEISLGNQHCAIPLLAVREVISRPEITPLPNMPAHHEGMINLRGQILGVIDTKKRMGIKVTADKKSEPDVVIIVESSDNILMGIVVDSVNKVLNTTKEDLSGAPVKDKDPSARFLKGVIKQTSGLVLILDLDQIVDSPNTALKAA